MIIVPWFGRLYGVQIDVADSVVKLPFARLPEVDEQIPKESFLILLCDGSSNTEI